MSALGQKRTVLIQFAIVGACEQRTTEKTENSFPADLSFEHLNDTT